MSVLDVRISRRDALAGAIWVTGCASGAETVSEAKKVLFVCQYGTVKSPIAREQFRRLAAARGINAQAGSRGISPEDHVSPALSEALAADGLDIRSEPIRTLTAGDLADADIIVAFDSLPAQLGTWEVRDWSDLPSMNANYSQARDILVARIGLLLNEIEGA